MIEEPGCLDALEQLSKSEENKISEAAKGALWKISGEEKHHNNMTISGMKIICFFFL